MQNIHCLCHKLCVVLCLMYVVLLTGCGGDGSAQEPQTSEPKYDNLGNQAKYVIDNITQLASNRKAFAAIKSDGSVVAWGHSLYGGTTANASGELTDVVDIFSTQGGAFAALKADATVATWGNPDAGGDNRKVQSQLQQVVSISATEGAFAALTSSGQVITWGTGLAAELSESVSHTLINVKKIVATLDAFCALKDDGTVVAWGDPQLAGNASKVQHMLTGVRDLVASASACAAIIDGDKTSVVAWGYEYGGASIHQASGLDDLIEIIGIKVNLLDDYSDLAYRFYGFDSLYDDLYGKERRDENSFGGFITLHADGGIKFWDERQAQSESCSQRGVTLCGLRRFGAQGGTDIKKLIPTRLGAVMVGKEGQIEVSSTFVTPNNASLDALSSIPGIEQAVESDNGFALLKGNGDVISWPLNCNTAKALGIEAGSRESNVCAQDVVEIKATIGAFAALNKNGQVITWGNGLVGGDARPISVSLGENWSIANAVQSYAAYDGQGNVILWGDYYRQPKAIDSFANFAGNAKVTKLFNGRKNIAFLSEDGRFTTPNDFPDAGYSGFTSVFELEGVSKVYVGAFDNIAYIFEDATASSRGKHFGGNSTVVSDQLYGISEIVASERGFTAIRENGSLVSWGVIEGLETSDALDGSELKTISDAKKVVATYAHFAVLRDNGTVSTWQGGYYTSDFESPSEPITNGVDISSNSGAFAALLDDGSVVSWGRPKAGGTPPVELDLSNMAQIVGTLNAPGYVTNNGYGAFAALKQDGSVVSWGEPGFGGNTSDIEDQLTNVIKLFANAKAFAALKADGSVVTWGDPRSGGDSRTVQPLLHDIETIQPFLDSFIALKQDGSRVSWGNNIALQ